MDESVRHSWVRLCDYHILVVNQKLQKAWIDSLEVLKYSLCLIRVFFHEIAVSETGTFVEYIVIWDLVKVISLQAWVIFFNFAFDHEGNVAEWQ